MSTGIEASFQSYGGRIVSGENGVIARAAAVEGHSQSRSAARDFFADVSAKELPESFLDALYRKSITVSSFDFEV